MLGGLLSSLRGISWSQALCGGSVVVVEKTSAYSCKSVAIGCSVSHSYGCRCLSCSMLICIMHPWISALHIFFSLETLIGEVCFGVVKS
jgi:hypothetical protein